VTSRTSIYAIHLPNGWWRGQSADDVQQRQQLLEGLFPDCQIQIQARSIWPVLSNDPLYGRNNIDPSDAAAFGDLFGLSFLGQLFQQLPERLQNHDLFWPNLELNENDIEALDVKTLLRSGAVSKIEATIRDAKANGRQVTGWVNVPSCLHAARYMYGDRLWPALHKGGDTAIGILDKASEIVKSGYQLAHDWFSPIQDQRLIHTPQCYLPLASKPALATLLPFEREIADFLRNDLGLAYRIHLCAEPTPTVLDFLSQLAPIGEFEVMNASSIPWEQLWIRPQNIVELLENNFFDQPREKIKRRAHEIRAKEFDVTLYEMDTPINTAAIRSFIRELAENQR
jgi:hypothetical protein